MVLIDTHALIWALYDSGKLSENAASAIRENDCCVSIASLWEMSIKIARGTLRLKDSITDIARRCLAMGVDILAITPEHCQQIQALPDYHRDPFEGSSWPRPWWRAIPSSPRMKTSGTVMIWSKRYGEHKYRKEPFHEPQIPL